MQSIINLFGLFKELNEGLVLGFQSLITDITTKSLTDYVFNLYLFSDNLIISITALDVIAWTLVIIQTLYLYKIVKWLVSLPFKTIFRK